MRRRPFAIVRLALTLLLLAVPTTAFAAPSAADTAAAKQRFEAGLKLLKEGLTREALAAFLDAKRLAPRESIQRNISHTHRELKEFGAAHDAYVELLESYGSKMNEASRRKVELVVEELKMMTGVIRVDISETGARVNVDSRDVGETPLSRALRLNLGSHDVRITKSGFEPFTQRIELDAGNQEVVVRGPLVRVTVTGRLGVSVEGGKMARLLIDGVDRGSIPFEGELDPGEHEVVARSDTAASVPRKLEIIRGQRVEITLQLLSRMGTVRVDPADSEAVILLDGRTVGKGAWEGDASPGRHEVEIRRPGFRAHKRIVIVTAGQVSTVGNVAFVSTSADTRPHSRGPEPAPHDYQGAYIQLALFGAFAVAGERDDVFSDCVPTSRRIGGCTTGMPAGGGLAVRLGHSFGWWALEGLLLGEYDGWVTRTLYEREVYEQEGYSHVGVARREKYWFHRIGAGFGLGGRVTSRHPTFRFTAGLAVGGLHRRVGYTYQARSDQREGAEAGTSNHDSELAPYWVPTSVLDGGVLIGATPGTKFYLGVQAQLDLGGGGKLRADPFEAASLEGRRVGVPRVQVAGATQLFVGPMLGLQFGE